MSGSAGHWRKNGRMLSAMGCMLAMIIAAHATAGGAAADDVIELDVQDIGYTDLSAESALLTVDSHTGVGAVLTAEGRQNAGSSGRLTFHRSFADPADEPVPFDRRGRIVDATPVVRDGSHLFAVAEGKNLHLVDPTSGEVVASVEVDGAVTSILAAPDAAIVYYVLDGDWPQEGSIGGVGGVDFDAEEDLGLLTPRGANLSRGFESNTELSGICPTGRYLYYRNRQVSPTGIHAARIDRDAWTISRVFHEHRSTAGYVVTPLGVAVNGTLHAYSLSRELQEFPHAPQVYITGTPYVAGSTRNSSEIAIMSLNTGKVVRRVSLADAMENTDAQFQADVDDLPSLVRPEGLPLLFDEASSSLLIRRGGEVFAVDLAALDLPSEPLLALDVDGPRRLPVDRPWRAEIEPLTAGTTIALSDAPEGVVYEDGLLSWTPALSHSGPQTIELTLSRGEYAVSHHVEVEVRPDTIELPFLPELAALDPAKRRLVVSSAARRQRGGSGPTAVAVFDLDSGELVLDEKVDVAAWTMAVTDEAILLGDQQADAIHLLRFDGTQRTLFTSSRPLGMTVAGKYLFVQMRSGMAAYALPDFDRIEGDQAPFPLENMSELPTRFGEGWLVGDVVYDANLSEVLLIRQSGLSRMNVAGARRGRQARTFTRWGVMLQNERLVRTSGQTIMENGGLPSRRIGAAVLDAHPAAVYVSRRQDTGMNGRVRYVADVVELTSGKRRSIPLYSGSPSDQGGGALRTRSDTILQKSDGLIVLAEDRAVAVSYEQLGLTEHEMPLHFGVEQSTLVARLGDEPIVLNYDVRGGKPPLRLSLAPPVEGVSADAERGRVTIEPGRLDITQAVESAAQKAVDAHMRRRDEPGADSGEAPALPPADELDWRALLADEGRARAERLLGGVEHEGLLIAMPLNLRARDADDREAALSHEVLLEVPHEQLAAAYETKREQVLQRHEEMRRQRQQPDLAEENEQLQQEVERLRTEVQILRDLLRDVRTDDSGDDP